MARTWTLMAVGLVALQLRCEAPTEWSAPHEPVVVFRAGPADLSGLAPGDTVPDRYVVVFHDRSGDLEARTHEVLANIEARVRWVFSSAVGGFSAVIPSPDLDEVRSHPSVRSVHPVLVGRGSSITHRWGLAPINQREYVDSIFDTPTARDEVHLYLVSVPKP